MKLGLWKHAVIMPMESSCVKFNNNKLHSLRRYNIAQSYIILHSVVQRLSEHNLKISLHNHIQELTQRK